MRRRRGGFAQSSSVLWRADSDVKKTQGKSIAHRLPSPVRITEQSWPKEAVPVVTVRCITYNHANFIRDAIEGFLMQETTFPLEIIIHDDASTDGTADIIREYEAMYPQLFRTMLQKENQYSKGLESWARVRKRCNELVRGEFIAVCEGDDYWTSPHKLQRQVEALESNPEVSLCYHRHEVLCVDSNRPKQLSRNQPVECLAELLGNSGVQMATMVWRHAALRSTPAWMDEVVYGDIPLQLMLADSGSLIFFPNVWSVYRKHAGGMSSSGSPLDMVRILADIGRRFNEYTHNRHHREISTRIVELHLWGAECALKSGDQSAYEWHKLQAEQEIAGSPDLRRYINAFPKKLFDYKMTQASARVSAGHKWPGIANVWRAALGMPLSLLPYSIRIAGGFTLRVFTMPK